MSLRPDAVILAGSISAGIHGALAPAHFGEGAAAGLGFVAATVVLAWRWHRRGGRAAWSSSPVTVFAGLIASDALAVTTGVPLLHPEPERVDGLALATKAVDAAGLVAASSLVRRRPRAALAHPQTKGTPA